MAALHVILIVFGFGCFCFATSNWCAEGLKVRIVAAGLAFITLAEILTGALPLFKG